MHKYNPANVVKYVVEFNSRSSYPSDINQPWYGLITLTKPKGTESLLELNMLADKWATYYMAQFPDHTARIMYRLSGAELQIDEGVQSTMKKYQIQVEADRLAKEIKIARENLEKLEQQYKEIL